MPEKLCWNKASKDTLVREIMARDVITVKPTDSLDVWNWWAQNGLDTPVVENNVVLGVISIGDVVKSIIEIQKTIQHLDSYIRTKA
jgi:predicted transcriptional regulator